MDTLLRANDGNTALRLLDILRAGNQADAAEISLPMLQSAAALTPGPGFAVAYPATAECPRVVACADADTAILACHGTDLGSQVVGQVTAFIPDVTTLEGLAQLRTVYSKWTLNAINTFYAPLLSMGLFSRPNVWVCGHSAGAGVVLGALARYRSDSGLAQANRAHAVTFGGNAYAGLYDLTSLQGADIARFMCDDDPVPQLPWLITRLLPEVAIASPAIYLWIQRFLHPHGGLVLDRTGLATPMASPPFRGLASAISLLDFLNSFRTDATTPHQTGEYARRLRLYRDLTTDRTVAMPHGAPDDQGAPPGMPPVPDVAAARNLANALASEAVRRRNEISPDPGRFVPGTRWRRRKVNGVWVVLKGRVLGGVASGKRNAGKLARSLNRADDARL